MISPELLRRYPFFGGLSHDQIVVLAEAAGEQKVDTGHYFFHEGEELENFYLVLEGAVAVVFEVPARDVEQSVSEQLTRRLRMTDVVINTVGPGEVFAWSAITFPHQATAGAKATTPCRVVAFDREKLLNAFNEDCGFGYQMMQKIVQISPRLPP